MENTSHVLGDLSKKLFAFGQFGKGPQIVGPVTARVENVRPRFNEDLSIELHQKLQFGQPGYSFTDAELDVIESWAGDKDNGTFYDSRITAAYDIKSEAGAEPGEYTWPKLAAFLRDQKERTEFNNCRYNDPQSQAIRKLKQALGQCFLAGLKQDVVEGKAMSLCDEYERVFG